MLDNQNKNRWSYFIKGLIVIFAYFFISIFRYIPFNYMHINPSDIPENVLNFYNILLEIILLCIFYNIFNKELSNAIKDIKKNHKEYFSKYFKVYLIGIIVMVLSNILINKLGGTFSDNEAAIRDEFSIHPIYTYISAVFLAPITEEIVFRLGIKSIIKNSIIYILTSGLIFGSLHIIGMPINILFPLYLLSYCSPGFAFAYMMNKTNNIFVSSAFHFMHNGIIMSMQVFFLIFG